MMQGVDQKEASSFKKQMTRENRKAAAEEKRKHAQVESDKLQEEALLQFTEEHMDNMEMKEICENQDEDEDFLGQKSPDQKQN